jgi:hypothetical protein
MMRRIRDLRACFPEDRLAGSLIGVTSICGLLGVDANDLSPGHHLSVGAWSGSAARQPLFVKAFGSCASFAGHIATVARN